MVIMRLVFVLVAIGLATPEVTAGVILPFGQRWDAETRTFSGDERSLVGGLRYSVSGGSYSSFRDQFNWLGGTPSEGDFLAALERSFAAWTVADPATGLTTSLAFTADLATSVASGSTFGSLDPAGAEIDLIASDAGNSGLSGLTAVLASGTPVTLTSGVANYAPSATIRGVDLHINNNDGALYTLDTFQRVLTHEIGHAIGLGDVDLGGQFIDDNFDPLNPVDTLTNSWAGLVDPMDPANSVGLGVYSIGSSVFATNGIDLLMESNGLGVGPTNPLSNDFPLTNDEYGMRQYLYPSVSSVPEPGSALWLALLALLSRRRRS